MKIYLSGAIASDPEYKTKFQKAENALKAKGHVVFNPASLPEGLTRAEYMALNIPMLMQADFVGLMPDWVYSEGAKIEYRLAQYVEKPTINYDWESLGMGVENAGKK